MNVTGQLLRRPFFIKLFNWEYWSFGMVYTWIYPVWIFLSIRARSFFFFSAANPSIVNGGFLGESKKDIHDLMPPEFYPRTLHFAKGTAPSTVAGALKENGFNFPLIGKPDTGGRGRGVKILKSKQDVLSYANAAQLDFHVQQFIDFPNEVGIFWYKFPNEKKGRISGIVRKEFLTVNGNGTSTIRELLQRDDRSLLQLASLERMYGEELNIVLQRQQKKLLVPYGNHARGAKFLDDSHLEDEQLTETLNAICEQIENFYFGRLDIRYKDWEDLKQGRNFSVIEVNGAGAEPTHIYDPRHNLFFAWKEIIRHWIILWKISRRNHRRGHPYLTVREGLRMFREDKENSKKLALMPE
jgi:hypothetical protein